jgi:hypothetical protein
MAKVLTSDGTFLPPFTLETSGRDGNSRVEESSTVVISETTIAKLIFCIARDALPMSTSGKRSRLRRCEVLINTLRGM